MKTLYNWRRTLLGLAAASVIGQCAAFSIGGAEEAVIISPPTLDENTQARSETAIFLRVVASGASKGYFNTSKG